LKLPPVAVFLFTAIAMWLVASAAGFAELHVPARGAIAAVLLVAGGGAGIAGIIAFRRHGTTVHPMEPEKASVVVTTGIYGFTRNPMYLGLAFLLASWAIWLQNLVAIALLPVFVAYMTRFQILPEEHAMTSRFGDDYVGYRAKVRRWL
jgi:protein-S-isoprenylcysteine O-methyltransferase Ste14